MTFAASGYDEEEAKQQGQLHQPDLIDSARLGKFRAVETTVAADPPRFVRLLAHPLRWQLLGELVHSDRAVRELTRLIDAPQNLVSYHLRQLRDGGLVFARRSSADGRDSYYAIDLSACQEALQAAGGSLHPALWLAPVPPTRPPSRHSRRRRRALFLCTGNSTRSQIAEALIKRMSDGNVEAASAGSNPKPLHPNAVRVLRKRGIDISANRTKHLDEFLSQRFDMVITLCDRVREVCPEFPSHPQLVHWSIPDPAVEGQTDRASYPAFERTATELETRISFLLHLLARPHRTRRSSHADQ
jgi:ArsR family transcriptional regulator, arsenate/arsenite/antimonite-responsive transcriptional repressor / arsenate reductase (thioredoxin)